MKGVLYFQTEGKNKGCWVMRRAGSTEPAAGDGPAPAAGKIPPAGSGAIPPAGSGAAGPAGLPAGSRSGRMSIRQPVSLAASRAFWPSLPIASDSW